jgi:hypothetical protein
MFPLEKHGFLAQVQQPPVAPTLVNTSGQHLVYLGVGLLAIAIVIVLGLVNRRLGAAIIASLIIAVVIMALVILA